MDRLSDHLVELVLSYISEEVDRHSLECVSKQWQRLIHNNTKLVINSTESSEQSLYFNGIAVKGDRKQQINRLKCLLKKCPNIRRISLQWIGIDVQFIRVIDQYCQRLNALSLSESSISRQTMIVFDQRLGAKITKLSFNVDDNNSLSIAEKRELLGYCPNIESLKASEISVIGHKKSEYLPKFVSIETNIDENNVSQFAFE